VAVIDEQLNHFTIDVQFTLDTDDYLARIHSDRGELEQLTSSSVVWDVQTTSRVSRLRVVIAVPVDLSSDKELEVSASIVTVGGIAPLSPVSDSETFTISV